MMLKEFNEIEKLLNKIKESFEDVYEELNSIKIDLAQEQYDKDFYAKEK